MGLFHSRLRYIRRIIVNKKKKKLITTKRVFLTLVVLAVVVFALYVVIAQSLASKTSKVLSVSEAQQIVDDSVAALPKPQATAAVYMTENMDITVKDVEQGDDKSLVLNCDVSTYDLYDTVEKNLNKYLTMAYKVDHDRIEKGLPKANSTVVRMNIMDEFVNDFQSAGKVEKSLDLYIYEMSDGSFGLYFSDEVINSLYGDYIKAVEIVNNAVTAEIDGVTVEIKNNIPYKNGIVECFTLNNYDSKKPDTSIPAVKWLNSIKSDFERNFLEIDYSDKHPEGRPRYMYIVEGLFNTIFVTLVSLLIGIVIGFIVAVIRVTNETTGALDFGAWICKIYLSIMRGTPLMIQLLIIYFVILLPAGVAGIPSAIVCFGLNSGAYVSEIVRGGIMSVDKGQMEAGRSLGFNYIQTMYHIVLPQAFKAVLPSLANEFITLLKETSVAFYIGVADLTLGGLKIRSITYSSFMPLVAIAIVYLILVLGLSKLVGILERRLRKGDNR